MKRFIQRHGKWLFINAVLWCVAKQFFLAIKLWGIENTEVQRFQFPLWPLFLVVVVTGMIDGVVLGLVDISIDAKWRAMRFSYRIVCKTIVNLIIGITLSMLIAPVLLGWLVGKENAIFSREIYMAQFVILLLYFFANTIIVQCIKLARAWMKTDDIMEVIANPYGVEEDRIFLFLDLKASTSLAEKLETTRYSRLLQQCFEDMSEAARDTQGEIYQYVGDEAVLTWKESPDNFLRAIQFFFRFKYRLQQRESFYQAEFTLLPEFKAGIHHGRVIKAQVGMMRKEIAFHGDAINTASRIQSKCNEIGKEVLVSKSFYQHLASDDLCHCEGDFHIRGKRNAVTLYSICNHENNTIGNQENQPGYIKRSLETIFLFTAKLISSKSVIGVIDDYYTTR